VIILFETYFEIPVWSFLCGCFDILFLLDRGWVCYFSCWIIGDWFWSVSLWPLSYFATSGCKFGLKFSLFHIFLLLPTSTSHFIRFNYYSVCSHWYSIMSSNTLREIKVNDINPDQVQWFLKCQIIRYLPVYQIINGKHKSYIQFILIDLEVCS